MKRYRVEITVYVRVDAENEDQAKSRATDKLIKLIEALRNTGIRIGRVEYTEERNKNSLW